MEGLNRKELEDYVIDLYHNQKKTFREIQKIVRKSPRDIRAILDKIEPERASLSPSSRAYQMFNEGRNLIEVATALNLREKEVSEYYKEYWNLNGMYYLYQIYEELREDIWSLIELHRRMKSESLSPRQVPRILRRSITLEHNIRDLEGEQARLEFSNKEAAKIFQQFTDLKQKDCKVIEENEYTINQQKREIENLSIQKGRLENNLYSIQHNDQTCIKVKQAVTQVMENVTSNPRRLLKLALASLFESERKQPGKLMALYYNNPPKLSVERLLSISQIEQYRFNEDSLEKQILDGAEQALNRIEESLANRCINEITNDTSEMLPVPNMLPGLSVNEGGSTATNIFLLTNDAESPSQPNTLPSLSLHEGHNTNPNTAIDAISISERHNNWLNEYVKSLGVADE